MSKLKILLIITLLIGVLGCTSNAEQGKKTEISKTTTYEVINTSTNSTIKEMSPNNSLQHTNSSSNKSTVTEKEKTVEANIHFLDTGNSDAILIRQGDKTVLIDGAESDDGTSIVSYLEKAGVKTINYMINTHPDADHVGGLATIMKKFDIHNLFVSNGDADTKTYRNFIETAGDMNLSPQVPLENNRFQVTESSYLQFFNVEAVGKPNEVSLIILFVNGSDTFLFTGDAGIKQEQKFMDDFPKLDVLKVGHHGSNSSTSDELLKRTEPEYAVILVGAGNTYGHPHKEVVERLGKHKVETYRTDLQGNITFTSSGKGVILNSTSKKNVITTKGTTSSTSNITTSSTTKAATTTILTSVSEKNAGLIIITPSGKEISNTYKFKKCDEVKEYFPNGFSKDDYPELYAVNQARDGDKDGYACE